MKEGALQMKLFPWVSRAEPSQRTPNNCRKYDVRVNPTPKKSLQSVLGKEELLRLQPSGSAHGKPDRAPGWGCGQAGGRGASTEMQKPMG